VKTTPGEDNAWWRRWALILAASLALIAATRWPLVPTRHLYHIDNVNFALALDDFNPARDQPQPPGDPLYVALTRWMRPFVPSVELLFPLSGVLGSATALAALWWAAEMMLGARAGCLAALLLAFNPIFWLAGAGNYVRVYLALGAAVVAGLAWKALDGSAVYFAASAAALGLFSGFRPEMAVLLAPLVLVPAWRRRAPPWHWLLAAGCAAITTLPWLLVTARASGGLAGMYRLNHGYLAAQSRHTSWLYGASFSEGLRMAGAALYWNLLGAVAWIAFVPQVWSRLREPGSRRVELFLALWFLPPLAFYTFVHIHNPDHALAAIPAVCVAGAWVLTRLSGRRLWWAAPAALAASVILFFYPTGSPFWASNYRIAQYTIRTDEQVYARVGLFEKMGPVTVLMRGSYITPREIDYYFPHVPVLDLEHRPALLLEGRSRAPREENGEITIAAGKLIWLDPVAAGDAGCFDQLRAAIGEGGSEGPVHWANVAAGARFRVGTQSIIAVERDGAGPK
jgi:hypothetical protein